MDATQCFQRGRSSFAPENAFEVKPKRSSTKARGTARASAIAERRCQRRYAFHASSGAAPKSCPARSTNRGVVTFTAASSGRPRPAKKRGQGKTGASFSSPARSTRLYVRAGSRASVCVQWVSASARSSSSTARASASTRAAGTPARASMRRRCREKSRRISTLRSSSCR